MRKISLVLLTLICISTTLGIPTFADGGWTEEKGYFESITEYTKHVENNESSNADRFTLKISALSTPSHTGKREESVINGTTNARAHGWTTWVGQYHYTRARMTKWSDETEIFTDSMRQWGTDGTEAISPWYEMRPDLGKDKGMARTYYGY